MSEAAVRIENLSKRFHAKSPPALNNISTVISKGQIVGLAGPDGSGKTTLIRMIAGLLLPSHGVIDVLGLDSVKNADSLHKVIGYMPQRFGLYEDLTVLQNLTLYADLKGVIGHERKEAFDKMLSFTSLAPFTGRLAKALSGGMKQKLGLACALLGTPSLLLLDEPSVGVDPISRRELWRMVKELVNVGMTVLWSTAYLDEAEKCDSSILLTDGRILFDGRPEDLTKRVEGRTFKVTNISGSRRNVLEKALNLPNVQDGVIQGSDVRIVLKQTTNFNINLDDLNDGPNLKLIPVSPRFEDAYVDILGGGPEGKSVLTGMIPALKMKSVDAIEAKGLTRCFGTFTAADNITFEVKCGEIFGLLGPNGAGKTTTFKMLCGLLKPTSGNAVVLGLDLQKAPGEARQQIGYMSQKFSLYGNLSVKQNLDFFSGIYNLTGRIKTQQVDQMIEIFNLRSYLDLSADELPLGYKQRLALSCALMHRPDILFLDEPTSGVDPITRREFWNHINGLVEKGVTVMVTTHFMDEAEYCDRIALIYRSRVINIGTPDSLKSIAKTVMNPTPTLEDAFIQLIEKYDGTNI